MYVEGGLTRFALRFSIGLFTISIFFYFESLMIKSPVRLITKCCNDITDFDLAVTGEHTTLTVNFSQSNVWMLRSGSSTVGHNIVVGRYREGSLASALRRTGSCITDLSTAIHIRTGI